MFLRLSLVLLFGLAQPAFAASFPLDTPQHEIVLDSRGAVVTDWLVIEPGKDGATDPLTGSGNSRHFALRLFIDGVDVSNEINGAGFDFKRVDGEAGKSVVATAEIAGGLIVEKVFRFPDEGYRGDFTLRLRNETGRDIEIGAGDEGAGVLLGPGIGPANFDYEGLAADFYDFTRVLVEVDGDVAELFAMEQSNANEGGSVSGSVRWAGLHNRYRLLAVAPMKPDSVSAVTLIADSKEAAENALPSLLLEWQPRTVVAGEELELHLQFYGGLKSTEALSASEPSYQGAMYSGLWNWMRWLSFAIEWLLEKIHFLIGNWGLAIIALAILVRVVLSPIGRAAARQQKDWIAKQELITPKISEIKAKYRGGEQVERILEVYEDYGVNPYAGLKSLLVVLLQIPVFVALFNILGQSVEFRAAEFLWIDSLAMPDHAMALGLSVPYFGSYLNLLPVLMGAASLAAMALSGTGDDGRLHFIMLLLVNIGFFVVFYHFPSGMVLYWALANVLQAVQAWRIRHGGHSTGIEERA